MKDQQAVLKLDACHSVYLTDLTEYWVGVLGALQQEIYGSGDTYTKCEQADMMLAAMATGASRWTQRPRPRSPHRLSVRQKFTLRKTCSGDQRNFYRLELDELLAMRLHRAFHRSTVGLKVLAEMKPLMPLVQLQALRFAVVETYMDLYPSELLIQTFDLMLWEQLQADFKWAM